MAEPLFTPASGAGTLYGDDNTLYQYDPNTSWSPVASTDTSGIVGTNPVPTTTTTDNNTQPTGDVLGEQTSTVEDQGPSLMDQLNDVFAPTMNYLNDAMSVIEGQQPGVEEEISRDYSTSKESLQGEKASGQRTLKEQGQEAYKRFGDASSAARRLFGELKTGGRQRFGGASSAGQAYGELIGAQLQRGLGAAQSGYNDAMMKIDNAGQDLQMRYDNALKELENQKLAALNESRRWFDEKKLEITRLRGDAESTKSSQMLDLLMQLRNQAFQIYQQDYTYKQQLAQNYQANQQQVSAAKQRLLQFVNQGVGAKNNYLANSTVTPQNYLTFNRSPNTVAPTYTGVTTKKDEDELYA